VLDGLTRLTSKSEGCLVRPDSYDGHGAIAKLASRRGRVMKLESDKNLDNFIR